MKMNCQIAGHCGTVTMCAYCEIECRKERDKLRVESSEQTVVRRERDAALLQLREITSYVDTLISQAKEMEAETGKARAERDAALRLKAELLKAADALLGKMGGPNSPVEPVYEDEFLVLELLVDKLNGNDVESIEKRASEKRKCEWCGGTGSHASMCRNFSQ